MLVYLPSTDSTNNRLLEYIRQQQSSGLPVDNLTTFYTSYQTAGRGQQGNSWESEENKNLLFSTCLTVDIPAANQFRINELVSLVLAQVVSQTVAPYNIESSRAVRIKWPNDIYIYNKKVCGILIENQLSGANIDCSVVGVGLNVNQSTFRSTAPNPASLVHFTDIQLDIPTVLDAILSAFEENMSLLERPKDLHDSYMSMLYHREGMFSYVERECSIEPTAVVRQSALDAHTSDVSSEPLSSFLAQIVDVDEFGRLILRDRAGNLRTYHFKQVRFVI